MFKINSVEFKKRHKIDPKQSLSIKEISELSKMPVKALMEVFNKGVGAYHTNPSSVRPNVKSPEQWAMARIYAFVMKRPSVYGKADKHIADKYKI
jgi:hypothetical protein